MTIFSFSYDKFARQTPNGMRYLRWGGDGEAVQPEKGYGVENCLGCAQNPQRQVHALLAPFYLGRLTLALPPAPATALPEP